jgi:membrane associated rhomboid family serine protease
MNYYERKIQFGFGGGLTPVVKYLLVANSAVYMVQQFAALKSTVTPSPLSFLAMNPEQVIHHFAFWQLFTYMFLHGNFFHIFFNMFTLFIFGCDVERTMGSRRFLHFYFLTGIGAALFYIFFNWNSHSTIIGASGAIYGILVAFAVLFPDRIVTLLLFFILPIQLKAKHLVAIFIGISVISGIQGQVFGTNDGIAHLAHLGGALIGYLFLKGRPMLDQLAISIHQQQQQQKITSTLRKQQEIDRKRLEIDRILDRINQVGFDGITEKEKKVLKEASEFLSKE